jgi:hypothetical protein
VELGVKIGQDIDAMFTGVVVVAANERESCVVKTGLLNVALEWFYVLEEELDYSWEFLSVFFWVYCCHIGIKVLVDNEGGRERR